MVAAQTVELQFERGPQPFIALSARDRVAAQPPLHLKEVEAEQAVREAGRGDVCTKFAAHLRLLDEVGNPAEHRRHQFGHAMTAILDEGQFSHEYACQSAIPLVQRDHRTEQMQYLIEQRPRGHRRERISHNPAHIFAEEQHQQVLFGARIEEQSPGADIRRSRDFASGGGFETLAAEQFPRGAFYPLELVTLAAFDPAGILVLHYPQK
ncbi:MAG: hypothetical protein WB650_05305 [Candidatus Binatus sp.]